jgi:hypothetical protein
MRAVVAICLGFVAGCGNASMAPVKGVVTWKDKPVADASISFSPAGQGERDREPGKPGTGFTDAQGVFQLSTFRPYDGAMIGKHRVSVTLEDTNPARCQRHTELDLEVKAGSNDFKIALE